MNRRDQLLRDSAAAVLEVALRRGGLPALEAAWQRFSERQRRLLPDDFLDDLRREAKAPRVADFNSKETEDMSFPKSPHELAMRQTAALLLRTGTPMTPEAISAQIGAELADVRAALDALTDDGQVVQMGRLFAWPRWAA